MARLPMLAAGGIVLRQKPTPQIAVVRLRKRDEWVLPKGKLDGGETARAAAEREVLEETGHDVSVHEFLGTLVYESGGKSKIVHYWRMEACGGQAHELMDDIRAVDWLPLDAAVERLSRSYERAFLANVGPMALELSRRSKAKPPASAKRRSRRTPDAAPTITVPALPEPGPIAAAAAQNEALVIDEPAARHEPDLRDEPVVSEVVPEAVPVAPAEPEAVPQLEAEPASQAETADDVADTVPEPRLNLVQKMREWLRRAA